jgi:hypothetical protein
MKCKPWLRTSFCRQRIACRMCRTQPELLRGFEVPKTCPRGVTADALPQPVTPPVTGPEPCPAAEAVCHHWQARKCRLSPADTRCLSDLRRHGPADVCPLGWRPER